MALILLAVIALAGYAYFGDMEPTRTEVRQPIAVGAGSAATSPAVATEAEAPTTAEGAAPASEEPTGNGNLD
ncbi:hypothetical protein H4P12_02370 [Paracoccus sp. 11-3]|uniref:Uncharacterized protein n=1 Tax=Paracoccus amoyensis TaxID=2760093 RepID=A0A926GBW9_9RHOB|nr:hypothetical protein [Paracoccus amoyensis]